MTRYEPNSAEDRCHAADEQMLDVLLAELFRPDPAAREARTRRVLEQLEVTPARETTVALPRVERASPLRRRRWLPIAVAAGVLAALAIVWQTLSPAQRAYATVEQTWRQASAPGSREYRVVVERHVPLVGHTEVQSTLFVDGAERFALRHPGPTPGTETWIGGNPRQRWIVPPRGPILVGKETMLDKWLLDRATGQEISTPYLQITTLLRRLADRYTLESLPDEELPAADDPGRTVRCRRVRGVLRDPQRRLPRLLDLWAEQPNGVARRLILDWQKDPDEFGRSKVTLELVGQPRLPNDWFEHSAHHAADRAILQPGPKPVSSSEQ